MNCKALVDIDFVNRYVYVYKKLTWTTTQVGDVNWQVS
jgi:hypothetical protein